MINISLGNKEKHEVSFDYSSVSGAVKILVDGKEHSSSRVMFIGTTPFIIQVGDKEKHIVRIELHNPLFFAIRGSNIKIFVDEQLIRQDHIGGSMILLFMIILIPIIFVVFMILGRLISSLGS